MTRLGLLAAAALAAAAQTGPGSQIATQNGATVTTTIAPVVSRDGAETLREGENVTVRVAFADATTKAPLGGGSPAAWLDRKADGTPTTQAECVAKVKRFAEGSTFSRTDLDLTSYYVVAMNADATLTVMDPRFGYGDSRLLAIVTLDGPGEDWAITEDGKQLFVSVPSANVLEAIDTASWKVTGKATMANARRVALQPDEGYLWVAEDAGVIALRRQDLQPAARIPTGKGYHHLAFSDDSAFAFVSNPTEGTVSIIDVRKLAVAATVEVGAGASWIAYSGLAKAAYVSVEGAGKVVAVDAATRSVRATMTATPGLGQIKFAPGGRFALAVNPADDRIFVVDAAINQVVQRGKLQKQPNQIAFTNKTAHIRHAGSDAVLMIALAALGAGGQEIPVADFSGGRKAPGTMSRSTPADGVVQASGENGVLVANPGDRAIYFYMEGAAAPMGNLSNGGHEPRAVLSVDRNLRERAPGVYETTTKLPGSGVYDLAVFLDRPRVVTCFEVRVAADPATAKPKQPAIRVEPRVPETAAVGETIPLEFRLTDSGQGKARQGAVDVMILMAGPAWQRRAPAKEVGEGVYRVEFRVPTAGVYNIFMESQSQALPYRPYATVTVTGRAN